MKDLGIVLFVIGLIAFVLVLIVISVRAKSFNELELISTVKVLCQFVGIMVVGIGFMAIHIVTKK